MKGRWVPLSCTFAHGTTGTKIMEEHGSMGLLVWVSLIAACKRSLVQGQYEHVSDAETWATFGLSEDPPPFTFEDFLRTTGRLRKTTQRRSGRITYVSLTSWEEWNKTSRRDLDSARKSSKRQETKPDTSRTQNGHVADKILPYRDSDIEREIEKKRTPFIPQQEQGLWDALTKACGEVRTGPEHSKRKGNVIDLMEIGATPDEVLRRAANLAALWPSIPVTARSLVNNWSRADHAPKTQTVDDETDPEVRRFLDEKLKKAGLK